MRFYRGAASAGSESPPARSGRVLRRIVWVGLVILASTTLVSCEQTAEGMRETAERARAQAEKLESEADYWENEALKVVRQMVAYGTSPMGAEGADELYMALRSRMLDYSKRADECRTEAEELRAEAGLLEAKAARKDALELLVAGALADDEAEDEEDQGTQAAPLVGDEGGLRDETGMGAQAGPGQQEPFPSTGEGESSQPYAGPLKPVGFVNHGSAAATVMACTYTPLGSDTPAPNPKGSTVSFPPTTSGAWPNSSRFLYLPLGTYTFCYWWEVGDTNNDGEMEYMYVLDDRPVVLDESDSDDLEFAEAVDLSVPPDTGAMYGPCNGLDTSE